MLFRFFCLFFFSLGLFSCAHTALRSVASQSEQTPAELLAASRLATAEYAFKEDNGLGSFEHIQLQKEDFSADPNYELWLLKDTATSSIYIVVVKKVPTGGGDGWQITLVEKSAPIPTDILRMGESPYIELTQRAGSGKYKVYFDLLYDEVGTGPANLTIEYSIAVIEEPGSVKASLVGIEHRNMQLPRDGYVSHTISCNTINGSKSHVRITHTNCNEDTNECEDVSARTDSPELASLRLRNKKLSEISLQEFSAVRAACVAD